MSDHAAPAGWFARWQEAEPVRLYLWSVATAVLGGAVVAGWLTRDLYVAATGVAAAVFTVGGAAAARSKAYAPVTVDELLDRADAEAEERAMAAYARGLEHGGVRTPEQVARDLGVLRDRAAGPVGQPATGADSTVAMGAVRACPYMDEHGARCTLAQHPRTVQHVLEE